VIKNYYWPRLRVCCDFSLLGICLGDFIKERLRTREACWQLFYLLGTRHTFSVACNHLQPLGSHVVLEVKTPTKASSVWTVLGNFYLLGIWHLSRRLQDKHSIHDSSLSPAIISNQFSYILEVKTRSKAVLDCQTHQPICLVVHFI
jgi:hypothetical protein